MTRRAVAVPRLAGSVVKGPVVVGPHSTTMGLAGVGVLGSLLRRALAWAVEVGLDGQGADRVEGGHVGHQLHPAGVLGDGAEVDGEAWP